MTDLGLTYWHGAAIRKNFARLRMTWALHLLLWNAILATTPLMRQRSTGRALSAMRQTFLQKSHFILSLSLPSVSLRQRRTIRTRSLPSVSRWQTDFRVSPSTSTSLICRKKSIITRCKEKIPPKTERSFFFQQECYHKKG